MKVSDVILIVLATCVLHIAIAYILRTGSADVPKTPESPESPESPEHRCAPCPPPQTPTTTTVVLPDRLSVDVAQRPPDPPNVVQPYGYTYTQTGFVYDDSGVRMPLYARRSPTNRHRVQYFVGQGEFRAPIRAPNGRPCDDDVGCEELADGDIVPAVPELGLGESRVKMFKSSLW